MTDDAAQQQRLADILDRVNRYQRKNEWYDRDRQAETLLDAVEMLLSRIERLEIERLETSVYDD